MVPGQTVPIYRDFQRNREFEGSAQLIEKLYDGLPFILEETDVERNTRVFICETWKVYLLDSKFTCIRKIRRFLKYGLASSDSDDTEKSDEIPIVDRFINIDGKEVF